MRLLPGLSLLLLMSAACSNSPATGADTILPSGFAADSTVVLLVPAGPSDKPLPSLMLTPLMPAEVQQQFGGAVADSVPQLQIDTAALQTLLDKFANGQIEISPPPAGPRSFRLTLLQATRRWEGLVGPDALAILLADVQPAATAQPTGILAWQQMRAWLDSPPVR